LCVHVHLSVYLLAYALDLPLLFQIILRPPRPPLFPYTTLFRSALALSDELTPELAESVAAAVRLAEAKGEAVQGIAAEALIDSLDRKSTRLNSSHGSISYAVFCLKKKKKENHDIAQDAVK